MGPCAKQTVTATIVTPTGRRYTGTNWCENGQTVCPRVTAGFKTGEGYELCQSVCRQSAHAEVNALWSAMDEETPGGLAGSTCYVEGHTYACKSCLDALDAMAVAVAFEPPPPDERDPSGFGAIDSMISWLEHRS